MIRRHPSALLLFLASCNGTAPQPSVDKPTPVTPEQAPASAQAPAATTPDAPPPHSSPLRPFKPGDSGRLSDVKARLPGLAVTSFENSIEEGMRPITELEVKRGTSLLARFRVEKGAIFDLRIYDPGFAIGPGSALRPGAVLGDTAAVKACGCEGEDGMDGFACDVGDAYQLMFETKDGDCGLLDDKAYQAAVRGRTIVSLRASNE